MLEKVEKAGDAHIVSWLPHGTSFRVHKPNLFTQNIVPVYFKQKQYKSFQRQLHLYGFQRVSQGPEKGSYFHKNFVKDNRELSLQIDRKLHNNKDDTKASNTPSRKKNTQTVLDLTVTSKSCDEINSKHHPIQRMIVDGDDDNNVPNSAKVPSLKQQTEQTTTMVHEGSLARMDQASESCGISSKRTFEKRNGSPSDDYETTKGQKFQREDPLWPLLVDTWYDPPYEASVNETMSWLLQEHLSISDLLGILDLPSPDKKEDRHLAAPR